MSMRTVTDHRRVVDALLAPALARRAASDPDLLPVSDPALLGRVLAEALVSRDPLPPFDNSQMDGYAVRAADLAGASPSSPIQLPIGRTTAAGDAPIAHRPGTASPVMTGAAIPLGADAVVPVERVDPARFTALSRSGDPDPTGTVRFASAPPVGEFVRPTGSDLPAASPLLPAGARLTPARIGLLATAGFAAVAVRPRPRILLVTTGDEVVDPGAALEPGRIRDANTPMLAAALREAGAAVTAVRVPDRPEALRALISERADAHELLVTSGGISMGAFEVVRDALDGAGVDFTGIAMQPGGPQGAGLLRPEPIDAGCPASGIPALCFPGNPVSSWLSAEMFLLPALRAAAGRTASRPVEQRELAHPIVSPAAKHQVRRGRIDEHGRVHVTAPGSHLLADLAAAEILAHIPVGVDRLDAGDTIEVWRLDV